VQPEFELICGLLCKGQLIIISSDKSITKLEVHDAPSPIPLQQPSEHPQSAAMETQTTSPLPCRRSIRIYSAASGRETERVDHGSTNCNADRISTSTTLKSEGSKLASYSRCKKARDEG